ncbi:MAG: biotin/lipoyl-binding protein [Lachnospiraceae bacterium]|nr:biotin/lipoyl-binding protein [Lachnospiraceae bacterium]
MKKLSVKNRIFIGMLVTAMGIGMAGCAKEEEGEALVVVSNEEAEYAYTLIEVKREDVVLSESLTSKYVQTKEQEVSFSEGGKTIEKIFVREGDHVKVGDILAEVSVGNLEEDIARLEYEIKKKELQKGYLDAHEEFDLTSSYYTLAYYSAGEEEDLEDQIERDEDIRESYKNQREDYDDDLEFDRAELNKLKAELAGSRLYATMDGMVYTVERDLEGTTSQKGEVIMTIIDGTEGIFEMEEPDYAQYFHEGESVTLEVTYSAAKGTYEVLPYQMGSWGEKQFFSIYDGPENDGIEVNTSGSIYVELDKRENVLSLPNECIFKADGKTYVYVLDDQNMKNICWVEIGLVGDRKTEIVSGLKEGDMVVKR